MNCPLFCSILMLRISFFTIPLERALTFNSRVRFLRKEYFFFYLLSAPWTIEPEFDSHPMHFFLFHLERSLNLAVLGSIFGGCISQFHSIFTFHYFPLFFSFYFTLFHQLLKFITNRKIVQFDPNFFFHMLVLMSFIF